MTNSREFSPFCVETLMFSRPFCSEWTWPCCAIFSDLWLHRPPLWLLQRNAVWWCRMITRQQNLLVCFASYSTPARSSSEELFHHPTVLATKALTSHLIATSDNVTCGKPPPLTEQEEASVRRGVTGSPLVVDAERDETQARQTPASTKHITALSPSRFLPVPDGVSTTTARTDTGRRKGRAQSESEDPQGGTSWLDSSLPATWATSNNYTTFHECLPRWKRTTHFQFRVKWSFSARPFHHVTSTSCMDDLHHLWQFSKRM